MFRLINVTTSTCETFKPISVCLNHGEMLTLYGSEFLKVYSILKGHRFFSGEVIIAGTSYAECLPSQIPHVGYVDYEPSYIPGATVVDYLQTVIWAKASWGFNNSLSKIQVLLYKFNLMSLSSELMSNLSQLNMVRVMFISQLLLDPDLIIFENPLWLQNKSLGEDIAEYMNFLLKKGVSIAAITLNAPQVHLGGLCLELEGAVNA